MRNSQDSEPTDFLVMPGSNRGPSRSHPVARANQMRAALHSIDNNEDGQQINYEEQYNILSGRFEELQEAYRHLEQYMNEQKESDAELIHRFETQNAALRQEILRLREGRQPDNASISSKYEKALKQITILMTCNKQLKDQVDHMRSNMVDRQEFQRIYSQMASQKSEIMLIAQREQLAHKEAEETKQQYSDQLGQLQENFTRQQQAYEEEIHKIMEAVKSYEVENEELRRRAQRGQLIRQQLLQNESSQQTTIVQLEQFRAKELQYTRQIQHLRQSIDNLQIESHNLQLDHEREVENMKLQTQNEVIRNTRQLQQDIMRLKHENELLQQAKIELQSYSQSVVEQLKKKQTNTQDADTMDDMKKYISTLKNETTKLKEILNSKDQLLADKSGLNREIVALNKQISLLTHENAQLKLTMENTHTKEKSLSDHIARLEKKVEEERVEASKIRLNIESRISQPQNNQNIELEHSLKLAAQNQQLKNRLAKALQLNNLERIAQNTTGFSRPERPIPINIRLKELRVLLELLASGSGGSTVTMETTQLLDLKTFTIEFEERLKLMANENEHLKKKVRDYKERIHRVQKEKEQALQLNETLTIKVEGYEKLTKKLQNELSKSIRKTQEVSGQMTMANLNKGHLQNELRVQINDLNQKLDLQQKYFGQQMKTKELEYEAKLVSLQKRLDTSGQELQSVTLYISKIQEQSDRIVRLEMQNNEYRVQLAHIERTNIKQHDISSSLREQNGLLKQVYEKLAEKESQILKMEYNIREKDTQMHERAEMEQELRHSLEETNMQVDKLRNNLLVCQQNQERVVLQAKRQEQEHVRKILQTTKMYENLRNEVIRLERMEQQLEVEKQNGHRLKVTNTQLTEKCNQIENQISRLKIIEQNYRELSVKYGDIQNSTQYSKAITEAERTRLDRIIKEKDNQIGDLRKTIAKIRDQAYEEIRNLRNNIGQYEAQSESIRRNSQVSRYKASEYEEDNARLKSHVEHLMEEIERYKQNESKLYEAQRRAMDANMSIDSYKYKVQTANREVQRLKQRLQEVDDSINTYQLDIAERDKQTRSLKSQILSVTMKLDDANFKNGSLKMQVERLQTRINEMMSENLAGSRKQGTRSPVNFGTPIIHIPTTFQMFGDTFSPGKSLIS